MIKFFIGNRSGVLLLLPFLAAIFVVINFFVGYHQPLVQTNFGFWGEILPEDSLLSQIIAPGLAVSNGILLNAIFNRNGFMEKNNYLPALLFVAGKSYFHSFYFLSGLGIAESLLILVLLQLLRLDQNIDGRRTVFNTAFFGGMAVAFYPTLIVFLPFMFVMIWILRPFVFRESVLTLVGFTIPLIYMICYGMWFDVPIEFETFTGFASEWKLLDMFILGGGLLLLVFATVGPFATKLSQSSIRLKKMFRVILWMLLFFAALATLEIIALQKMDAAVLILVGLVFFLTYGFGVKNIRQFPVFIFYTLLVFSVGKFFLSFEF